MFFSQLRDLAKVTHQKLQNKQSKYNDILEIFAKFKGFKSWNDYANSEKEKTKIMNNVNLYSAKKFNDDECDRYFFHEPMRNYLYIQSIYHYSSLMNVFYIKRADIDEIVRVLKDHKEDIEECNKVFEGRSWKIENQGLTFFNDDNVMSIYTINDHLIETLSQVIGK